LVSLRHIERAGPRGPARFYFFKKKGMMFAQNVKGTYDLFGQEQALRKKVQYPYSKKYLNCMILMEWIPLF
jgi:hypothetical protein